MISKHIDNGIEIVNLESPCLRIAVVPALGGKILSIFNRQLEKEFLWTNTNLTLTRNAAGSEYDPNFLGGIDELIPNDIPESIDSIEYPDHGELWTTSLKLDINEEKITVHEVLPLSGLYYSKTVWLDTDTPVIHLDYLIRNETGVPRHFLWKLHAALTIKRGDRLLSGAKRAKVVDPTYSRFKKELSEFNWPLIENTDASVIPAVNGTMDFFYLYDIAQSEMQLASGGGDRHLFSYQYDKKVFPYQWYFASYGGFLDHYTAILEPCTNMPISVNEAIDNSQCAMLKAGESLRTQVRIFAGAKKEMHAK